MNGAWVRIKQASEFYGVSIFTLRGWEKENKIECRRTFGNQRLFYINSTTSHPLQGQCHAKTDKKDYIYIRVSSKKQEDDLNRQKSFLLSKFPTCKVVKDIGSGLNYKRKGLRKLLELSNQGKVSKIIVFSKDRLCRFGFDLLEYVFENNGTEVVVFESDKKTKEEEFCEDILSILQVFSCRWNGRRKYRIDIKDDKNKKDKVNIEFSTEENV